MDILYLLIPLSAALVLLILGVFGWALHQGQFEDLDHEGVRILEANEDTVDGNQAQTAGRPEQSPRSSQE